MLGTYYFLIEPRADAREHFTKVVGEDADLLLDPLLLDPEAKGPDEVIPLAKLVFLARIREYDCFSSAENAVRVFGSDEISVDVFDRWWTIRDVEYEFSFDEMIETFLSPIAAKINTHGNAHLTEALKRRLRK
jgi:hypothetical protein